MPRTLEEGDEVREIGKIWCSICRVPRTRKKCFKRQEEQGTSKIRRANEYITYLIHLIYTLNVSTSYYILFWQ